MASPALLPSDGTVDVGSWLSDGNATAQPTGLFLTEDQSRAVPLRSRAVHTTLHCDLGYAETTEELSYVADADCSVAFRFPLPPRSAIFKFEATIGDRRVTTQTKRKSEAEAEYSTAVQQGHSAVLAKQETHSIFSVELGNLEAHTEAVVRLSYLGQLERVAGTLEYCHTATWVPPYTGSAGDAADGPDKTAASNPKFASKVHYKLSYDVRVVAEAGVKAIDSASHGGVVQLDLKSSPPSATLSEEVSDASKDFTLLVELAPPPAGEGRRSRLALQEASREGGTKLIAQAVFVPRLEDERKGSPREVWLVVDGSGSMWGQPEVQARDAASFFIKDLPHDQGIKFNVVMFGSSHQFMYPACVAVSEETAAAAEAWVQANVNANWGGTEILGVLEAIYRVPAAEGHSREILFLTDGGVSGNEEERIMDMAAGKGAKAGGIVARVGQALGRENSKAATFETHIYCLGIGNGVHRAFLDGVSQRSGGVAQFVVDSEDVAVKAGYLKKCALTGGTFCRARIVARNCLLRTAPAALPPRVFPGEPITVLAEVVRAEEGASISLALVRPDGSTLSEELPLGPAPRTAGDALAVLHAMCYVGSLLEGTSQLHLRPDGSALEPAPPAEVVKDEVVRAAVVENLVTPYTASVGVMLQSDPLDSSKTAKHEVPLQVPAGRSLWGTGPDLTNTLANFGCYGGAAPQCAAPPAPGCAAPMSRSRMLPMKKKSSPMNALRGAVSSFGFGGASVGGPPPPPLCQPAPKGAAASYASFAAPPMPCAAMGGGGDDGFAKEGGSPAFEPQADAMFSGGGGVQAERSAKSSARRNEAEQSMDLCKAMDIDDEVSYQEQVSPPPPPSPPADDREILRQLNQLRSTEGCWPLTDQLLALLASRAGISGTEALRAARPEGVPDSEWATLLVTAFLRKRLGSEKGVWSAWESKAVAWLGSRWKPADGGSLGAATIAAMKLL